MIAKIYAELIHKGEKTLDDVPKEIRDQVKLLVQGES